MSAETTSSYVKFLADMAPALLDVYEPGPFMQMVLADLEREKAADEAWLASLTPHQRQVELTRRRIARCEARLRAALDFRRCDCE